MKKKGKGGGEKKEGRMERQRSERKKWRMAGVSENRGGLERIRVNSCGFVEKQQICMNDG